MYNAGRLNNTSKVVTAAECLFDIAVYEAIPICREQTRAQERRRIVNVVLLRPLIKLSDGERNLLWLFMALQLVEAHFVLDDLAKQECEELFVVPGLRKVFAEAL